MIEKKDNLFSLGDLVSTKNHPYFQDSTSKILIKARAEFTPPILNIFEVNTPEYFNENTGKKAIQYHCVYYDSKIGDFETKWFKENELKAIKSNGDGNAIIKSLKGGDKSTLINKQCILNSVELELAKLKSNYEGSFSSTSNKITAHLDFLPPLLEIIELVNTTTDKNFDKKTGKRIKSTQQVKCKWYNPTRNTFSEKILPIDVLQLVELPNSEDLKKVEKSIKTGDYYCFETSDKENSKTIIATIRNIVFNHYKYEIYGTNLVNGQTEKLDNNQIFKTDPIPLRSKEVESTKSVFVDKEYPRIEDKKYIEISLEKDQFYFITYQDKFDSITKRIIKVVGQYKIERNDNQIDIIEGICYLRNQETRYFNPQKIVNSVKVNASLFEN